MKYHTSSRNQCEDTDRGDGVGVRWQRLETFPVLHVPDTYTLVKLTTTQTTTQVRFFHSTLISR